MTLLPCLYSIASLNLIGTIISWCTGWQGTKCVLRPPKSAIKLKMLSLQVCSCTSVPKTIGSLSMPTLNSFSKHSTTSPRGVCFSAWSWKPWWTFRAHLLSLFFSCWVHRGVSYHYVQLLLGEKWIAAVEFLLFVHNYSRHINDKMMYEITG